MTALRIRKSLIPAWLYLVLAHPGCWQRQDHDILPPRIPNYTLSGSTVDIDDPNLVLPDTPIHLEAVQMIYDVTFDPVDILSDSSGNFRIDSVYPGQYQLIVKRSGYIVLDYEIFIEHDDRSGNLLLPRPMLSLLSTNSSICAPPPVRVTCLSTFTWSISGIWRLAQWPNDYQPIEGIVPLLTHYTYDFGDNSFEPSGWLRAPHYSASMAFDGNLLYSIAAGEVAIIAPLASSHYLVEVLETFQIDTTISGITWDGSGFWSTKGSSIQYHGGSLRNTKSTWAVPTGRLRSPTFLNGDLWCSDMDNGTIRRISQQGLVQASYRPIDLETGQWVIIADLDTGIDGNLWIYDNGKHRLYTFDVEHQPGD